MPRKPTRRRIRRRATRNRSGGTVYQNDRALDNAVAAFAQAPTDQHPLSPREVVHAMIALIDRCGWRRLEACRAAGGGSVTGYCVDDQNNQLRVTDLIGTSTPTRPVAITGQKPLSATDVVQAVVALLDRSGWMRLEILRSPGDLPPVAGYCLDGQHNPLSVADLI